MFLLPLGLPALVVGNQADPLAVAKKFYRSRERVEATTEEAHGIHRLGKGLGSVGGFGTREGMDFPLAHRSRRTVSFRVVSDSNPGVEITNWNPKRETASPGPRADRELVCDRRPRRRVEGGRWPQRAASDRSVIATGLDCRAVAEPIQEDGRRRGRGLVATRSEVEVGRYSQSSELVVDRPKHVLDELITLCDLSQSMARGSCPCSQSDERFELVTQFSVPLLGEL